MNTDRNARSEADDRDRPAVHSSTAGLTLDDLSDHEAKSLQDFVLHRFCGYTYDKHGIIGNLTFNEVETLLTGFRIWNEMTSQDHAAGDQKPGQTATAGDEAAFEQFAAQKASA